MVLGVAKTWARALVVWRRAKVKARRSGERRQSRPGQQSSEGVQPHAWRLAERLMSGPANCGGHEMLIHVAFRCGLHCRDSRSIVC
jgi:hypothetical protein